MKRHQYLLPLLCCAMIWGCSNDSSGSGSTVEDPGDKTGCSQDEDCDSGKCLDNGKCAKLVKKGESCDEKHICKGDLKCKDGVCTDASGQKPKPEDGKCVVDDDCEDGSICVKEKCEEVKKLQSGDACSPSDKTAVCPENQGCYLGKCMTEEEYENADKCKSDDDCTDENYKTCLSNGLCGTIHSIGEDCDGNQDVCEEGLECAYGTCSKNVLEGGECSDDNHLICETGLNCIEGFCRKYEKDLEKGSECNASYRLCKEEFVCHEGICITEIPEDGDCNDSAENERCASGLACLKGKCTPFGDTCESTANCKEKDSFCCKSDECGLKDYCIPYDETTTHDENCRYTTKPGVFEGRIQCRWSGGAVGRSSAVVGKLGNKAGLKTVVAFVSYSGTNNGLQIINPETCETLETIPELTGGGIYPAIADLDGDGLMEIVARRGVYKWNPSTQKHEPKWNGNLDNAPAVFDVDGDTVPEVISGTAVYKGLTGEKITGNNKSGWRSTEAMGYFGGHPTLISDSNVLRWENKAWKQVATLGGAGVYTAYADFGTPGAAAANFDYENLDGFPEIVRVGDDTLTLFALVDNGKGGYNVQTLMSVSGFQIGGPVTIGDFDSDGLPEIGVASRGLFGVYDPRCKKYEAGKCADKYVLWERWSQDQSSGQTGSSLFDFDGDGQAEAVYADECFTRVYEGKTGKVLFSIRRSSGTSWEAPIIADVDDDGSAEIVMGSESEMRCTADTDNTDPIHEGIWCIDDEDCPTSKGCNKNVGYKDIGLCTCTSDSDCNTQYLPGESEVLELYKCVEPIHSSVGFMENRTNGASRSMVKGHKTRPDGWKAGDYKVCRATRNTKQIGSNDLVIYKDRLDRWVSSRNIWNQHSYNILNIEDDGKAPTKDQWTTNWNAKHPNMCIDDDKTKKAPMYNNFRLNKQGQFGAGAVPDITGRFIAGSICGETSDGRHVISGKLCNRGTKPVSTQLPASFFYYDKNNPEDRSRRICTSYTKEILGVGKCDKVGCEVSAEELAKLEGQDVIMVTNLDENGFASTVECNSDNNTDIIHIDTCKTEIEIVN